jgi:hypothetical protein
MNDGGRSARGKIDRGAARRQITNRARDAVAVEGAESRLLIARTGFSFRLRHAGVNMPASNF